MNVPSEPERQRWFFHRWPRARTGSLKGTLIGLAAAAVVGLLAITIVTQDRQRHAGNQIDDPQAKVTVDGTDIVVSGIQGVQEFRLKAGDYTVHQTKDGKPEKTEVVSIKQGEKTALRVTFEAAGTVRTGNVGEAIDRPKLEKMLTHTRSTRRLLLTLRAHHPRVKEFDAAIEALRTVYGVRPQPRIKEEAVPGPSLPRVPRRPIWPLKRG